MTTQLVEILRKTLEVIERSEEFRKNEPGLVDLRARIAREIGELEVLKVSRSSDKSAEALRPGLKLKLSAADLEKDSVKGRAGWEPDDAA